MVIPNLTRAPIAVEAVFEDEARVGVAELVEWTSSDPGVFVVTDEVTAEGVVVEGTGRGSAILSGVLGDLDVTQSITVSRAALEALELEVVDDVQARSDVGELRALGRFLDSEAPEDVTAEVTWVSSAPGVVAAFDDAGRRGLVYGLTRGAATITASLDGISGSVDVEVPCTLTPSGAINLGQIMVNASWPAVIEYDAEGNQSTKALSIEDLMCDSAYDGYRAFVFSLNAGWCGPCHAWMRTVSGAAQQIEDAGILPVFVIGDTTRQGDYAGATIEYADRLVSQHTTDPRGLRIGDADTVGAGPNGIKQVLNITRGWPTLFIVRRSDMEVLTLDSGAPRSVDPVIQTVNLRAGSGGGGGGSTSDCAENVDEDSEPNDVVRLAPTLDLGTYSGGICNGQPDFFRIDADGSYTVTIEFTNAEADLDLFEWNPEADNVMIRDNRAVQSIFNNRDFETLELSGSTYIAIRAKRGGTGYTLRIDAN